MTDSAFYQRLRDKVAEPLLTKYGQSMTLTQVTEGSYDTEAGSSTDTSTDVAFVGAVMPPSKDDEAMALARSEGGTVTASLYKILAKFGAVVVPTLRDTVAFGGVTYRIIKIESINPGGTAVLYTLYVVA